MHPRRVLFLVQPRVISKDIQWAFAMARRHSGSHRQRDKGASGEQCNSGSSSRRLTRRRHNDQNVSQRHSGSERDYAYQPPYYADESRLRHGYLQSYTLHPGAHPYPFSYDPSWYGYWQTEYNTPGPRHSTRVPEHLSTRAHGTFHHSNEFHDAPHQGFPQSSWHSPTHRHYSTRSRSHEDSDHQRIPARHLQKNKRGEKARTDHSGLPEMPRRHYVEQSHQAPANFSCSEPLPKPLPLLILDLNGTLVYRGARGLRSASDRSRSPILRPYLGCFLQYCLSVQGSQDDTEKRRQEWGEWDKKSGRTPGKKYLPHGSHFWQTLGKEPVLEGNARFNVLLWSSAQPANVDLMARAILSPVQAEQLLRVYARDTLVTKRLYGQKAPSVKDLEIIWAALNSFSPLSDQQSRGESRLFAEARSLEHQQGSKRDTKTVENELRDLWQSNVVQVPRVFHDATRSYGAQSDGKGYGPHNTLLLDDSTDKAHLQPFNHILVPEFDAARAKVFVAACKKDGIELDTTLLASEDRVHGQHDNSSSQDKVDDVLLQVVGVLEHARYQINVSSWIRFGGLGDLGGMSSLHPSFMSQFEDMGHGGVEKMSETVMTQAMSYFDQLDKGDKTPISVPQLNVRTQDRTQSFWAREGHNALLRHGITPKMYC